MKSAWWGGWVFAAIILTVAWFLAHSAVICLLLLACLLLAHIGYGLMVINDNFSVSVEWLAGIHKSTEETRKSVEAIKDEIHREIADAAFRRGVVELKH
jgi:hypothetical protein